MEWILENVDWSRVPAVALISITLLAIVYVITRQPHQPDNSRSNYDYRGATGAKSKTVVSTPLSDELIKAIDERLSNR